MGVEHVDFAHIAKFHDYPCQVPCRYYVYVDAPSGTATASSVCTNGFSLDTNSNHSALTAIFCPRQSDLINFTCRFSCNVLRNAEIKNVCNTATDQSSGITCNTCCQHQTPRGQELRRTILTSKNRPHRSRRLTVCEMRSDMSPNRRYSPRRRVKRSLWRAMCSSIDLTCSIKVPPL